MSKKQWFYGKNVLITGASSGIGLEISKLLVGKFGCNVYGVGRSIGKLEKAKEIIGLYAQTRVKKNSQEVSGSFTFATMDVSNLNEWKNLKDNLDKGNFKVDIVINNAGVMLAFNKFHNQSMDEIIKVVQTNFLSHIYSYKTFIDDLILCGGAMINIASSAATCPVIGTAIYGASKAAVKNFTEVISMEHKKEVYIACVMPGFTTTDLFREEKELGKFVKGFATSSTSMAKKILKKMSRRKNRAVLGFDAHVMSGLYRLTPKIAPQVVSEVLKTSGDSMFEKVFSKDTKKDN